MQTFNWQNQLSQLLYNFPKYLYSDMLSIKEKQGQMAENAFLTLIQRFKWVLAQEYCFSFDALRLCLLIWTRVEINPESMHIKGMNLLFWDFCMIQSVPFVSKFDIHDIRTSNFKGKVFKL